MISIVICDDEIPFLDTIKEYYVKYKACKKVDLQLISFTNGEDLITNYRPDFNIIFLDISMPGIDGITAAKKIRELDTKVVIVFLTSIIKYGLMGYTLGASNYIIKPITYKKFESELDKAVAICNDIEQQYVTLRNIDGLFKLYVNDIKYIDTYNRRTKVHTKNKEIICFYNMKELENKLEMFGFIRCHSSYIVNVKYIESVEKLIITLTSLEQIPISQQKRKDVMKSIAKYFGEEL